jgi:hypothetical protein
MITKSKLETFLDARLEDYAFEEVLEEFDITPLEAFVVLFDSGLIDEELLEELTPSV